MSEVLHEYLARLQVVPDFDVLAVGPDGNPVPWYHVPVGAVVGDLALQAGRLREQVALVGSQIAHWGRLAALTRRVWQIRERELRTWEARKTLELLDPPSDPELVKTWKKPTVDQCKATYRVDVEYVQLYSEVERAEEAHNAASAFLEAFKAQKDVMRAHVRRSSAEAEPHLEV